MQQPTGREINQQQKVHPQPMESPPEPESESVQNLISKIFTNISSLKSAYIQLQEAHTPYDPDKIQAADKLVISELKILSQLKHFYRENNPSKSISPPPLPPQDSRLSAEIHEQQNLLKTYEVMVKKFQSEIQNKDSEILHLQQQIQDAIQTREKLEKNLKLRGLSAKQSEIETITDLTPHLFISAVDAASKAIHDFSKPLINMMKAAEWDLDAAANSIEPDVVYSKRSHKKYAFEAHICQRMFSGFQQESFSSSVKKEEEEEFSIITKENFFQQYLELRGKDPLDAVVGLKPNSSFGNYCRNKYLLVVHPKMEVSFFGNLDQRNYVMGGGHPQTPFYMVFLKLAKAIWVLHRLAYSFEPRIKIFQVNKGSEYSDVFMDSVVAMGAIDNGKKPEVGLMVLPGFWVGGSIIRSRVYLSDGIKNNDWGSEIKGAKSAKGHVGERKVVHVGERRNSHPQNKLSFLTLTLFLKHDDLNAPPQRPLSYIKLRRSSISLRRSHKLRQSKTVVTISFRLSKGSFDAGKILTGLLNSVKRPRARYTVLYVSDLSRPIPRPLPSLGRFLAEGTGNLKSSVMKFVRSSPYFSRVF